MATAQNPGPLIGLLGQAQEEFYYDQPLSEAQLQDVERYLMERYGLLPDADTPVIIEG